ncbi:hypothetical protein EMIT0158MI4_60164 [Burkholderia ambifaria]
MNSNTAIRESLDGRAHVHCVPAKSVELCDNQHVTFFHPDQ